MDKETEEFIINTYHLSTSINMSVIGLNMTSDEKTGLYSLEHNLIPAIHYLLKAIDDYPHHFLSDEPVFRKNALYMMNRNAAFIDCVLSEENFKDKYPKAARIFSYAKESMNKIICYLNN